jgi:hypothetical protein
MNDVQEINSENGFLSSILLLGPLALLVVLGCVVSVILAVTPSKRRSLQIGRIILECVALGFCAFYLGLLVYTPRFHSDGYLLWRLQGLLNLVLTIFVCMIVSRSFLVMKRRREEASKGT